MVALAVFPARSRSDASLPRLRGLPWARPELVERLQASLFSLLGGPGSDVDYRNLAVLLEPLGAEASAAILRAAERAHGHAPNRVLLSWSFTSDDESPARRLVRDRADASILAAVNRALPDRRWSTQFRLLLVVAACREGNREALPALVRIALDETEHPFLRMGTLVRLPRVGGEAPRELRRLLRMPLGGLDEFAAATLARMGDLEAPSLVLRGLERRDWHGDLLPHCALAVNRVTRGDRPVPAGMTLSHPDETYEVAERRYYAPFLARYREWLVANPSAFATEFETERTAYLASDRRRREMALASFEDVFAAGEDFDFAAAATLLDGTDPERRSVLLEQLHSLAREARDRLATAGDPASRRSALTRFVHGRGGGLGTPVDLNGALSFLANVVGHDAGNCLGYTSLYVALAERLDLDVRAVHVPRHVFVRWRDGGETFDIETTAGGAPADAGGHPAARELTRRELLGKVLVNWAGSRARVGRFEEARLAAERATLLDAADPSAWLTVANVAWLGEIDAYPTVARCAARAIDLARHDRDLQLDAASLLALAGDRDAALAVVQSVLDQVPDDLRAKLLRVAILRRAGRLAEARELVRAELARDAEEESWRIAEIAVVTAEDPERGVALAESYGLDQGRLAAVEVLLEPAEPTAAACALALRAIDAMQREVRREPLLSGPLESVRKRFDLHAGAIHARWTLLRSKALLGLGRRSEAREEFTRARGPDGPDRLTLELARALGD